jgi:hypothetical protein
MQSAFWRSMFAEAVLDWMPCHFPFFRPLSVDLVGTPSKVFTPEMAIIFVIIIFPADPIVRIYSNTADLSILSRKKLVAPDACLVVLAVSGEALKMLVASYQEQVAIVALHHNSILGGTIRWFETDKGTIPSLLVHR